MSFGTDALVRSVEEQVPATAPLVADHIDFYEELLPHVLFGDITRWAQDEARRDPASPALARLLELLEAAYVEGDNDVRNVLTVSFVENLDVGSPVLARLGPNLRPVAAELGLL